MKVIWFRYDLQYNSFFKKLGEYSYNEDELRPADTQKSWSAFVAHQKFGWCLPEDLKGIYKELLNSRHLKRIDYLAKFND
jgi:hypothetical protein